MNSTASCLDKKEFGVNTSLLNSVLDNMYEGILVTDKQGRIVYINKTYEKLSGFTQDEILGVMMKDFVKDGLYTQKSYPSSIAQRRPVQHNKVFRKTGIDVNVSCRPIFSANEEIDLVISNTRCINGTHNMSKIIEIKDRILQKYKTEIFSPPDHFIEEGFICSSVQMREIMQNALKVSKFDVDVLLEGETGTGKNKLAKFIYNQSGETCGRFIEVNCGAIPVNLIESELFGYEKGSFTGADIRGKKGLFEEAEQGVIFLDEVDALPLDVQAKLLTVLQERQVRRIGSADAKKIKFKVIGATNKDLEQLVKQGKFRQDLYYRLNVIPLRIPPLRERKEEIVSMVEFFLKKYNCQFNLNKQVSPEVMNAFLNYDWPGNARELENLLKRLVIIAGEDSIRLEDLPVNLREAGLCGEIGVNKNKEISLTSIMEEIESELIKKALDEYKSLRKAADALKINPSSLYRRIMKYKYTL